MIIVCPDCNTNFSVPDSAMGPEGREVRCSRCGCKWMAFASRSKSSRSTIAKRPVVSLEPEKVRRQPEAEPLPPPRKTAERQPERQPLSAFGNPFGTPPVGSQLDRNPSDLPESITFDDASEKNIEDREPSRPKRLAVLSQPSTIIGAVSGSLKISLSRRKWSKSILLIIVIAILAAAGSAIYLFQDNFEIIPQIAALAEKLHIRKQPVGYGLGFRELSSDRSGNETNEILVIRGIIFNKTDQPRDIPNLQVSLQDKSERSLQEKIISPPVGNLEPRASIGFKVTFEQPDPSAEGISVIFTAAQKSDITENEPLPSVRQNQ